MLQYIDPGAALVVVLTIIGVWLGLLYARGPRQDQSGDAGNQHN